MHNPSAENSLRIASDEPTEARVDGLWRVFYTTPRAEKKCEERLLDQDIEVFLPTCVVVRQWKDRKKKVVEPLFRNYIFAQVDEEERVCVLRTQGIVRCVSFGGTPAIVSDAEIEQLQILQKDPQWITRIPYPMPDLGAMVTVTEGPLRGLRGEVLQHRGQTHVVVRVTAIRQAIRINVPAAWVEADRSLAAT